MTAERFERLLAIAEPELQAWLSQAVEKWRRGTPLDRALGLSGPPAMKARDEALRRAAEHVAGKSTWARAGNLERAINHFEVTAWKRRQKNLARFHSPLKQALHEAFTAAEIGRIPMLYSRRALWNLIR